MYKRALVRRTSERLFDAQADACSTHNKYHMKKTPLTCLSLPLGESCTRQKQHPLPLGEGSSLRRSSRDGACPVSTAALQNPLRCKAGASLPTWRRPEPDVIRLRKSQVGASQAGATLLGAVSRLRRVKSKAPALQRSRFCKAAVETGRAPSLLLRRRLKPSPSRTGYNS
jgi:hypothetical protein